MVILEKMLVQTSEIIQSGRRVCPRSDKCWLICYVRGIILLLKHHDGHRHYATGFGIVDMVRIPQMNTTKTGSFNTLKEVDDTFGL
jgi:hypothetical protein